MTPTRTPSRRRGSNASSVRVSKAIKESSIVEKGDKIAKFGQKKTELKKQKIVKVSKKFKNLVTAALSEGVIKGTQVYRFQDFWHALHNIPVDSQSVLSLGGKDNWDGGWNFTLDYFLDAVVKLFKGNTASSAGFLIPTKDLDVMRQAEFTVINSFTSYTVRNVSHRTIIFKIIECAPKYPSSMTINDAGALKGFNNTGGVVDIPDGISSPYYSWSRAIVQDHAQGYLTNNTNNVLGLNAFNNHPSVSKQFNKQWSMMTTEYILAPGQQIVYKIQGPSNLHIDMQKMYKNDILQNVQKFSRACLGIAQLDMVGCLAGAQRHPIIPKTIPGPEGEIQVLNDVLAMERTDHIRITMPESHVGVNFRKDRYNVLYPCSGQDVGPGYEIHEQQPSVEIPS